MPEELGKIERLSADKFQGGRKLYFVPLIYCGRGSPDEYVAKFNKYWNQVEKQVKELELKLGKAARVYHEMVALAGEEGAEAVKRLNERSYQMVKDRLERGARLEAAEERELLSEFLDWNRCLLVGLRSQGVIARVYEAYVEVGKKRNEYLARHLDETLAADEAGMFFMREGHQVQFPADIQIFYVAPPALDEIDRWLRDREAEAPPEE